MLLLTSTTDKIQVVTDAAVTVDVHASYMDYNGTTITPGRTNTAISTATTTDVVAAPASSTQRNIKALNIRNTNTSSSVNVTVQHIASGGTPVQLFKCSMLAGEHIVFADEVGWQHYDSTGNLIISNSIRFEKRLRVNSDQVFATASTLADITDLSNIPVSSGKKYSFESILFHTNDAATTAVFYAVNGPSMTDLQIGALVTVTNSVTAAAFGAGCAISRDIVASSGSTGSTSTAMSILSGSFLPVDSGVFAIRAGSEVTVANGVTVKTGSWLRLWENDN